MNEFELVSTSQLDRLVDNELSESERRAVLLALDQDPDGWRRLALLFVESHVLRSDLRRISKPQSGMVTSMRNAPGRMSAGIGWRRAVIVTACCLATFAAGRWSMSESFAPVRGQRSTNDAVAKLPSSESSSSELPADGVAHGSATFQATYESESKGDGSRSLAQSESSELEHQRTLRLALEDATGHEVQTVDVPVMERTDVGVEDLLNAPSAISESVQRALLRSGRRLREQRQLFEVRLDDGRRGVVPISEVRVESTGWDVFQ